MSFLSGWRLLFLLAPIALLAAYLIVQRRRHAQVVRFTSVDLLDSVAPQRSGWQRHLPAVGVLLSLVAMVIAFAQPVMAVPVPLDPDTGFHPHIEALEKAITSKTKAILLNSPSNPTGAVFTRAENLAIGALAKKHDLWIVSDEVYATMIHGNHVFHSPFAEKDLEERTIVVSSISKSHALPGFRCGWIAASPAFCDHALPVIETMLFGSQPFLEDATAFALDTHFDETDAMKNAYLARARGLMAGLKGAKGITTHLPEGGMFLMLDIRKTGLSGEAFAWRLLREEGVVTMPGESFGAKGAGHLRVALTVDETEMAEAARRIKALAARL